MKTEVVTITPARAKKLLQGNTNNRRLDLRHVAFLAQQIESGQWKLNGDAIRMNGDRLIDGQNRLHAVIKANKPIKTLLITGLDADVFDTIDTGKKRTFGDTLYLLGEKNAPKLAGCLVLLDKYLTGRVGLRSLYSNQDVEKLLEQHPGMRDSIAATHRKQRLAPRITLTTCHYIFSQMDRAAADRFFEDLTIGAGLSADDPVFVLRERLMANTLAKAKLSQPHIMALIIKAWNMRRMKRKCKLLRWADAEEFPIAR